MIIERIEIGHFGSIDDLSYDFGPHLNVIEGPNESGKSMIAAFVRYMLYGFGAHRASAELSEREKRISRTTMTAEGAMIISLADGRRFRIERKTVATEQAGRIGYREESVLIDLSEGGISRFHTRPGEAFFSVPEQVYVNTAYFDQLSDSRLNEGEMTQAMENLLFSGDERVNSLRALKSIKEARNSLTHPGGVGGAIAELQAKSDSLRIRLQEAIICSAHIRKAEARLHSIKQKIASAEAERDNLASIDEDYHKYLTICSFDKLHEIEKQYQSQNDTRDALHRTNAHEGFLPDDEYLTALRTAERVTEIARQNYLRTNDKLTELRRDSKISDKEQALLTRIENAGGVSSIEEDYNRRHSACHRKWGFAWFLTVVAALFLAALLIFVRPLALTPPFAMALLGILCLIGLSITLFLGYKRLRRELIALTESFETASGADLLCRLKEAESIRLAVDEKRESIRLAEENAEITRENFERFRLELSSLAAKWGKSIVGGSLAESVKSISAEALAFLTEDRRLMVEIAEIRGRMGALRAELAGKSEIAIRAQVSPARREAMKTVNYRTIQEGLEYYRGLCESFYEQRRELLDELDEYRRTAENPALLRSEYMWYFEKIHELQSRRDAYELALSEIDRSSDALRAKISPRLSEYASPLLQETTNGRYEGMSITNRLLATYRENGAEYPIAAMSGSTKQIAYLAMRLALISILYDEMPPLCFDESLSHQDAERSLSILKFLVSPQVGMQCILFTCHSAVARTATEAASDTVCFVLEGENNE